MELFGRDFRLAEQKFLPVDRARLRVGRHYNADLGAVLPGGPGTL